MVIDLVHRGQRIVDGRVLAAVRIGHGLVSLLVVVRLIAHGWVGELWERPTHQLHYPAVTWLQTPPAPWPTVAVVALGVLSSAIVIGWQSRVCLALWALGFAWLELLDASTYLNHYYLLAVLGLLLSLLPCDAAWSLTAHLRGPYAVPVWTVWAVRALAACVWTWAGVAKINGDWLLRGEPLATWLSARADLPLVGPFLAEHSVAVGLSWAGMVFDLSIASMLMWRRSRPWAVAAAMGFHLVTAVLFPIGVFPWLMLVLVLAFFDPLPQVASASVRPVLRVSRPAIVAVLVIVSLQWVIPARALLHPNDVQWSQSGFRWSWRVMVADSAGYTDFTVRDQQSQRSWHVNAAVLLSPLQLQQMSTQPDLIVETAHLIAAQAHAQGHDDVAVTVDSWVSWNARPSSRLIDPTIDLSRVSPLHASSVVLARPA